MMDPLTEWIDQTDNEIGFNETDFHKCDNNFAVKYGYAFYGVHISRNVLD